MPYRAIRVLAIIAWVFGMMLSYGAKAEDLPVRVEFPSADKQTMLVGYYFKPEGEHPNKAPAIVMMHGRAGAYSTSANGTYNATTLSKRHAFWGHFWASQGYAAILVDGFGPRGYPHGFPVHSYDARPDAVNEVTVRPLDAYAALRYLRTRPDIDGKRIALQGWSNGGSATLVTMANASPDLVGLASNMGFKGALAFYPACTLHGQFDQGYKAYAPLLILSGEADEEVSTKRCEELAEAAQVKDGNVMMEIYPDATHDFDDPGIKRQSVPANAKAADNAIRTARSFIRDLFSR